MASKINPPISKKRRICKEEKLFCEFEFSDNVLRINVLGLAGAVWRRKRKMNLMALAVLSILQRWLL
jgi:hypothetical protein